MSCPTLESVAEWALGEMAEADEEAFEAHYFECGACFERARHMQRFVTQLRASVPAVLTVARRQGLEARRPAPIRVDVSAGERAKIGLGREAPLGFWVMHAALHGVTRVDLEVQNANGDTLFNLADVPFDPARGEVVLACQAHYRGVVDERELHMRLMAHEPGGPRPLGEYVLDHEFESL